MAFDRTNSHGHMASRTKAPSLFLKISSTTLGPKITTFINGNNVAFEIFKKWKTYVNMVIPSTYCRRENVFLPPSLPSVMSVVFLEMVFVGKELEIATYKTPTFIPSYHTHVDNKAYRTGVDQKGP